MGELAINGGTRLRTERFHRWPVVDEEAERQLLEVLRSGKWGRLTGSTNAEAANKWGRDQFERWGLSLPPFSGYSGQTGDASLRGLWQWGEIAVRFDPEIECPMARDQFEHVIEKPNARTNGVSPLTFETEAHGNVRFLRSSIDYGAAHRTSSIAAMKRRVCSTMPVPMRRQPSHPGSDERSRM